MKAHENVPIWGNVILKQTLSVDAFTANLGVFPEYFRRILAMTSVTSMSFVARRLLLSFVIYAFQSLDIDFVKKELAPLAQIHIWAGLSSEEETTSLRNIHLYANSGKAALNDMILQVLRMCHGV